MLGVQTEHTRLTRGTGTSKLCRAGNSVKLLKALNTTRVKVCYSESQGRMYVRQGDKMEPCKGVGKIMTGLNDGSELKNSTVKLCFKFCNRLGLSFVGGI